MRILLLSVSIDNGSVGRIVRDLYQGYKMAGHECKIAIGRGSKADIPEEDIIYISNKVDVYAHAALSRLFGKTALAYSKIVTKKFVEVLDVFKPEVVHMHGVYGYFVNMPIFFKYLADKNINVISTLHSCWDFTGHCCYFDFAECDQWKSGCKKCSQKKAYPSSYFFENSSSNYNIKKELYSSLKNCVIVTPSEWLSTLARESFLNTHTIRTIYNGIDLNKFRPTTELYLPDIDKPIILCSANLWERRKGWEDVVELSSVIPENIQLVVLGVNSDQAKQLDKKAISIEHTNNVEEMVKLYSQATVFFNPTYEDNYPTVNLEAICCGSSVVTYATGGSPETLHDMNHGIVIQCGDFDSLFSYTYKKSKTLDFFSDYDFYSKNRMCLEYINLIEEFGK